MNRTVTEWIIIGLTLAGSVGGVYMNLDQRIDDQNTVGAQQKQKIDDREGRIRDLEVQRQVLWQAIGRRK